MNIATGYEWATHQPVIRAALQVYDPKYILELGPGIYSTPLFIEHNSDYLCVENDFTWINYLIERYNINIMHHDLCDVNADSVYDELTLDQKRQIIDYYFKIKVSDSRPRLLFVDQYSACRTISINTLRYQFDVIIYHDSELRVNRFDLVNNSGFMVYELETDKSHTTLMTRIAKPEIETAIMPYIKTFMKEHPDCQRMNFKRYDD